MTRTPRPPARSVCVWGGPSLCALRGGGSARPVVKKRSNKTVTDVVKHSGHKLVKAVSHKAVKRRADHACGRRSPMYPSHHHPSESPARAEQGRIPGMARPVHIPARSRWAPPTSSPAPAARPPASPFSSSPSPFLPLLFSPSSSPSPLLPLLFSLSSSPLSDGPSSHRAGVRAWGRG